MPGKVGREHAPVDVVGAFLVFGFQVMQGVTGGIFLGVVGFNEFNGLVAEVEAQAGRVL
jgi:hypothetical protein